MWLPQLLHSMQPELIWLLRSARFFAMSAIGVVGMMAFMAFEFTVRPPLWVHFTVTFPLIALACVLSLRPFKGWLVSEQYIHKAAPPEWESIGKHGD